MCLAVPMTIVKIEGMRAIAENRGVEREVNITLVPEIKLHEKVLVHAGFAIEQVDEETAREIEEMLEELDSEPESAVSG